MEHVSTDKNKNMIQNIINKQTDILKMKIKSK